MAGDFLFCKGELILAGRFRILEYLGMGSYGTVFKAFDEIDKREVAVKMNRNEERHTTEDNVYSGLRGIPGIPFYVGGGYAAGRPCLIIQLLEKTVDLHVLEHGPIEHAEVSRLGKLLLRTLQRCHRRHVVHRDIKPQNIMLQTGQGAPVPYLVDWGLANTFWDATRKQHRNPGQASRVVGTDSFMSIRVQQGHRYSRRDDLESLGYALLWMSQGSLPWSRSRGPQRHSECCHHNYIRNAKRDFISQPHPDFPAALHHFLSYSHNLGYQDDPDYDHLYDILDGLK